MNEPAGKVAEKLPSVKVTGSLSGLIPLLPGSSLIKPFVS